MRKIMTIAITALSLLGPCQASAKTIKVPSGEFQSELVGIVTDKHPRCEPELLRAMGDLARSLLETHYKDLKEVQDSHPNTYLFLLVWRSGNPASTADQFTSRFDLTIESNCKVTISSFPSEANDSRTMGTMGSIHWGLLNPLTGARRNR